MKYLLKFRIPVEAGNAMIQDAEFAGKMKALLQHIKAEAAYFTPVEGQRGGYIVLSMEQASHLPAIAEPFFLWLKADVEFLPVMEPDDLAAAGPSIGVAIKQWA